MQVFNFKKGNTSPSLVYNMRPTDQTLAGSTVRFKMMDKDGNTLIDAPAVIVSALPPIARYDWQPGDTDIEGSFDAQFDVVNFDETTYSSPNKGFLQIQIGRTIPDMV